jgi:hypothetical protein
MAAFIKATSLLIPIRVYCGQEELGELVFNEDLTLEKGEDKPHSKQNRSLFKTLQKKFDKKIASAVVLMVMNLFTKQDQEFGGFSYAGHRFRFSTVASEEMLAVTTKKKKKQPALACV